MGLTRQLQLQFQHLHVQVKALDDGGVGVSGAIPCPHIWQCLFKERRGVRHDRLTYTQNEAGGETIGVVSYNANIIQQTTNETGAKLLLQYHSIGSTSYKVEPTRLPGCQQNQR